MKTLEDIELHVDVTQDDIENGLRGKGAACPIAIAVNRALKLEGVKIHSIDINGENFDVDGATAYNVSYCDPQRNHIFQFINDFDKEHFVQPFSFRTKFQFPEDEDDYDEE